MKIAYWNMLNSEEKQTDHYAAIGIMLALAYKKKTVLMENDYDSESLEWIFKGIKRFYYVKEDTNYFLHRNGFDKLITEMHGKSPSSQVLESSTVELINDYLYYIPQSKVINHLAYEYEMYHQMQDIIQSYEYVTDYIMIKAQGRNCNLNTKHILEDADLVVVELTQNQELMEAFFDNYSSLRQKAIFVFSDYRREKIPISYIMKKYHLKKERVAIITRYMPLYEAYLKGELIPFLRDSYNCSIQSEHLKCMKELQRIGRLIIRAERTDQVAKANS